MKITILAHGSRGDVQPYIALGLGLAHAGHAVRLAAPEVYREWVQASGLEFAPLPGDPTRLMQRAAHSGRGLGRVIPAPLRAAFLAGQYIAPVIEPFFSGVRRACQGADAVIHSLLTTLAGRQAARELGLPDLSALVFPVFSLTDDFPNPLFPDWQAGLRKYHLTGRYNYLSHREFNRVFGLANRFGYALYRAQQRRHGQRVAALAGWAFDECAPMPILYGISPHALPAAHFCPGAHLTGYWFLDAPPEFAPPPALLDFLAAGPPPVLIGFGSLIPRDAEKLARTAVAALEQAGQRGILLGGWGGSITGHGQALRLPRSIYALESIPFDWLFPRLSAAVHHGGTGTTAAALRAGIPSVIVPFTFDQPFWGRQVHALGAGPKAIPPNRLTPESLAAAIDEAVRRDCYRQSAAALGEKIRAEDGVGTAVALVEEYFKGRSKSEFERPIEEG